MGAQPVPPDGEEEVMRDLRQQARTTASIEPGEQERLLEKSALGDRASLDRLVAANLGMVIRLAEGRQDKGLSVPDLVQEGSLGLVEAARTFAVMSFPVVALYLYLVLSGGAIGKPVFDWWFMFKLMWPLLVSPR